MSLTCLNRRKIHNDYFLVSDVINDFCCTDEESVERAVDGRIFCSIAALVNSYPKSYPISNLVALKFAKFKLKVDEFVRLYKPPGA